MEFIKLGMALDDESRRGNGNSHKHRGGGRPKNRGQVRGLLRTSLGMRSSRSRRMQWQWKERSRERKNPLDTIATDLFTGSKEL